MQNAYPSTTDEVFCPYCEDITPVSQIIEQETIKVLGEPIQYDAQLLLCEKCHKRFATPELEDKNFQIAYDSYRIKHKLLSPREIQEIRHSYHLSQRNLASLLGWGEITIHRYESGAIQDAAHNELLYLMKEPKNALKILGLNKQKLSSKVANKLEQRINEMIQAEDNPLRYLFDMLGDHVNEQPSEFNGFRKFDINKFESLVIYLLENCRDVFKTKLNKLLWYCDFKHFSLATVSITGSQYVHLPYGPVPDQYDLYLWKLLSEGLLRNVEVSFRNCSGERLEPKVKADISSFSKSEIETINYVIARLGKLTAKQLTEKSHREKAYRATRESDLISYGYATTLSV